MARIYHVTEGIRVWISCQYLGNSVLHCFYRLLELFSNPKITSKLAKWRLKHDLLDLTNIVPFFDRKVEARRIALHIFGKKNVRIIVKLYKCHIYPLGLGKAKSLTNRFSEDWKDSFRVGCIGIFFIPVVVVISIWISTSSGCDVVIHSVFAEVTKDRY